VNRGRAIDGPRLHVREVAPRHPDERLEAAGARDGFGAPPGRAELFVRDPASVHGRLEVEPAI
jgi:hypothetical protein